MLDLKGFSLLDLKDFVTHLGKESYRAEQLYKWIYQGNVDSFDEMTNLSKDLRRDLAAVARIGRIQEISREKSVKDDSVKFLFSLADNTRIESVLMPEKKRNTLCVSTQVGCAIDCKFCATGMMGLSRNLSAGEIVDQYLTVRKASGLAISNLVMMGMGEPLHNYDNVIAACRLLNDEEGPNLAARRIVVSTSGLVPRIRQFTDEGHKYKLAVSLNATTDKTRTRLMPLNKKWPLATLKNSIFAYTKKSGLPVTLEYVLLAGINDTIADAERLIQFTKDIQCKVNLIPYNTTFGEFRRPDEADILRFYEAMRPAQVPVMIRWSKGDDIAAGCGQLAGKQS